MILAKSHLPFHLVLAIARNPEHGTPEIQQYPWSQPTPKLNLTDETNHSCGLGRPQTRLDREVQHKRK